MAVDAGEPDRSAPPAKPWSIFAGRDTGRQAAQVVHRAALAVGEKIEGPALIQEPECAIYVGPDAVAVLDEQGNISMEVN